MIKNFLILVFIFSVFSFADPLSGNTTPGSWMFRAGNAGKGDTCRIDTNGAFDTLAGATDSSDILTNFAFEDGWEYILTRDAFTGTGSDSVKVEVRIYAYDENSNLLYYVTIDSMITSAGEQIAIPYGSAFGGPNQKYSIRFFTYTDAGGQIIINRLYLHKRKWYQVSPGNFLGQ